MPLFRVFSPGDFHAAATAEPVRGLSPLGERKLNTNFFFLSNFSGTSGISRQNPGISRKKSLVSLVSRDIPNFSAPTPSHGRPPPHWRVSGPKSLGLSSFFLQGRRRSTRDGALSHRLDVSLRHQHADASGYLWRHCPLVAGGMNTVHATNAL